MIGLLTVIFWVFANLQKGKKPLIAKEAQASAK